MNDATESFKELESLKAKAKELGLSFSGNISAKTLRQKINEYESTEEDEEVEAIEEEPEKLTKADTLKLMKEARKLNRVIITCHNPVKAKLTGTLATAGNSIIATETKYIKFDQPWHVSTIMLNSLREKKYLSHYSYKDSVTGNTVTRNKLLPEYTIQELPPLSKDDLTTLAKKQAIRSSEESAI